MIEKEWIAVVDGEEMERGDDEGYVRQQMRERGYGEDDFDVLAVPKQHWGMWI